MLSQTQIQIVIYNTLFKSRILIYQINYNFSISTTLMHAYLSLNAGCGSGLVKLSASISLLETQNFLIDPFFTLSII